MFLIPSGQTVKGILLQRIVRRNPGGQKGNEKNEESNDASGQSGLIPRKGKPHFLTALRNFAA